MKRICPTCGLAEHNDAVTHCGRDGTALDAPTQVAPKPSAPRARKKPAALAVPATPAAVVDQSASEPISTQPAEAAAGNA